MTADKVVAELTFGFWTALFNKQYAKDFWKPLMYAFPILDTSAGTKFLTNSIRFVNSETVFFITNLFATTFCLVSWPTKRKNKANAFCLHS